MPDGIEKDQPNPRLQTDPGESDLWNRVFSPEGGPKSGEPTRKVELSLEDIHKRAGPLRVEDLPLLSREIFRRLGKGEQDSANRAELAGAVQDRNNVGKEAQAAALLYHAFAEIGILADGGSKTQVGLKDIDQVSKRLRSMSEAEIKSLDRILGGALLSKHAGIDRYEIPLSKLPYDGSPVDIGLPVFKFRLPPPGESSAEWQDARVGFQEKLRYIAGRAGGQKDESASWLSFLVNDAGKERLGAWFRQGVIENCYFLAAAAAIAYLRPGDIDNMITKRADGSNIVKFPAFPKEQILVPEPTEGQLLLQNGRHEGAILEQAFGELLKRHPEIKAAYEQNKIPDTAHMPAEFTDGRGWWEGLAVLTGKPPKVISLVEGDQPRQVGVKTADVNLENSRAAIIDAFSQNKPKAMIALTKSAFSYGPDADFSALRRDHMYAVLNFDPNKEDGGEITLWDTYGENNSGGNPEIKMSWKQFQSAFRAAAVESR